MQWFRALGINLACTLLGWNSRIRYADLEHDIGWRDHVRWYLEAKLTVLFAWFWHGSDEELLAVEQDEVPVFYMSHRQLAYYIALQDFRTTERGQLLLEWRGK